MTSYVDSYTYRFRLERGDPLLTSHFNNPTRHRLNAIPHLSLRLNGIEEKTAMIGSLAGVTGQVITPD